MHQWIFLKLGHNGPSVMGLIWCSGIVGLWSNKGPRDQFDEILQNASPTISVLQR